MALVELLVATAVALAVCAAALAAIGELPDAFSVQTELADMHQRTRIAVESLRRDLASTSGVVPYRWGSAFSDPPGSYKDDTITAVGEKSTVTYWLKTDSSTGTFQLMSHAGGTSSDVPVVDSVVLLRFGYLGDGLAPIDATQLMDGPWHPDASAPDRWDADLLRVRAVTVAMRVQAAVAALRGPAGPLFTHAGTASGGTRWAPDIGVTLTIALRNQSPGT